MSIREPYHEGELAVQEHIGVSASAGKISMIFSETIPMGAIEFISQQPMCVVGSVDNSGNVWASLLFGHPGFMHVENSRQLAINLSKHNFRDNEVLWSNLRHHSNAGILVIDFATRRRLRINGRVRKLSAEQYVVDIERIYANCPKYIQSRVWSERHRQKTPDANISTTGSVLDKSQLELIKSADTFFVASAHPDQGVDASHRGGFPGFVKVINETQIRVPDYSGNNMYNTLGNFYSYPHAGLVFMDFTSGMVLQLTGRPHILWEQNNSEVDEGRAQCYWLFEIEGWRQSIVSIKFDWKFQDFSPFIPPQN